jgi:uncharacterized membrane protein YbaN (DUF454 family)
MNIPLTVTLLLVFTVIGIILTIVIVFVKRKSKQREKTSDKLIRWVLITAGTIFLGLGTLGIFLPILPATPFLLLAAACYARSSKRFYYWLLHNKWFGTYIRNYWEGKGVSLKAKVYTISLLWITILFSAFFIMNIFWVRILLILIAVGVTIHVLTIKTYKQKKK